MATRMIGYMETVRGTDGHHYTTLACQYEHIPEGMDEKEAMPLLRYTVKRQSDGAVIENFPGYMLLDA